MIEGASAMKDYYKILGVSSKASDDEIKKAFRKLAREHHPDANPNNKASEAKFKEFSEAYETLGDSEKRKMPSTLLAVRGATDFSRMPSSPPAIWPMRPALIRAASSATLKGLVR